MCCGDRDGEWMPDQSNRTYKKPLNQQSSPMRRMMTTPRVRVHRFIRRVSGDDSTRVSAIEMEEENFRLYLENKTMMEENKQLRKRIHLLQQENRALLSLVHQNKKRSSSPLER